MHSLWQNVRQGARMLVKSPEFTAPVVSLTRPFMALATSSLPALHATRVDRWSR
jgi:hypothetical protein